MTHDPPIFPDVEQDTADREAVRRLIERTLPPGSGARARSLVEGLVEECLRLAGDGAPVADLKLVATSLAETRRALACFAPYAGRPKVTVFGSARTKPSEPVFALAREFGRRMAEAGFMVITGAGPGIMDACHQGAGREMSFGVDIRLPFEQSVNATVLGDPKVASFKYFFTRKLFFIKEANAVVLFPGGFGTHDEAFEALTLVQTGKSQMVPVVCLDVPGGSYWQAWDRYVREQLLAHRLIGEDDLSFYKIASDIDDAVSEITRFYRVYHSSRFLRRRVILRLNAPVDDAVLTTLSHEFSDILDGKPIRRVRAYKEEADEPALRDLPRLELAFQRMAYGRLRRLVDRLNELGSDAPPPPAPGGSAIPAPR